MTAADMKTGLELVLLVVLAISNVLQRRSAKRTVSQVLRDMAESLTCVSRVESGYNRTVFMFEAERLRKRAAALERERDKRRPPSLERKGDEP